MVLYFIAFHYLILCYIDLYRNTISTNGDCAGDGDGDGVLSCVVLVIDFSLIYCIVF